MPRIKILSSQARAAPHAADYAQKNADAKAEPVEPFDLAKELDKITGRKDKKSDGKINVEHGSEARSRIKEKITPKPDDKKISV